MPLNNVISSGGYLLSQTSNSSAISEPRTQELIDTDYRRCKNTRVRWYHGNISANSIADTLRTSNNVEIGDLLLIRTSDGTIHDFIVNTTTATQQANLVPTMTSTTLPYGIASGTVDNPYYAFDDSTSTYANVGAGEWIQYQFTDNPKTVYSFFIDRPNSHTTTFVVEGSTNGLDYTLLTTVTNPPLGRSTYTVATPGSYSFYRLRWTASNFFYLNSWGLLGDGIEIDTSTITGGETPDLVWAHTNRIRFNETFLVENHKDHVYGESGSRLHVYSQYDECVFYPQREIVVTYDFKVAGNLMLEQTNEVYDLWLVQGNVNHTDNISPANEVQVSGVDAPLAADAYKIFDGDINTEGYSIATGTGGLVDFTHTYIFDVPTRCYALEMTTSLYTQAPSKYKVEASIDGSTNWIVLLDIQQGVSANDLKLTKYFDGALYDAYKAYRIVVTEGNTDNDLVTAKQYRLMQEDPNA